VNLQRLESFTANVLEEHMPRMEQVKVLIIDDERAIASTLSHVLNREGFRTCIAYSGEEGIHIAGIYQPDILISDVFMGGITGIAAAIEVKARIPSCEVLLLSGNISNAKQLWDSSEDEIPFEILSKPIHPLDLLAKVHSLVRSFQNEGTET
jgi:CheY-like chemotaxis protein